MAGAGIDGLVLAAVALTGAGVEQHAGPGCLGRLIGVEHRQAPRFQDDVARVRSQLAGLDRQAQLCSQAPSAPSRIRTSGTPAQRSSHQARAADIPPRSS